MKKLFTAILLLSLSFQCKVFKPSDLDPSQDLGTLQTLLRYLALLDAFNTYSQTIAFMKFTDSNGNPYGNGTVEYSVYNEADENGVPTSPLGETGNVQTYTLTLDLQGRGFLFFSERGIATLYVKNSGNATVGTTSFRIYNGITKQAHSFLSTTGSIIPTMEDISNFRNNFASAFLTPLGAANGRQFLFAEISTSYIAVDNNDSVGYIISSADGENYDQVTKIKGVTINTRPTTKSQLKISQPTFNGTDYVFFLSEELDNYPAFTFLSNRNLFVQIPAAFTPSEVTVQEKTLPTGHRLFSQDISSWFYPTLYVGNNRYMITPYDTTTAQYRPALVQLDSNNFTDLYNGFSCLNTFPNINFIAFQVVSHSGNNYLQCQTNALGTTYLANSIRTSDLSTNNIIFDAVSPITFNSPVFAQGNRLVALLNNAGTYVGYTFPNGSYASSNPTITKNTNPITNFTSSFAISDPHLRAVKSSNSVDYFILSNQANFSAPTVQIIKSSDNMSTAFTLPNPPSDYPISFYNLEQIQSANGKLNLLWSTSVNLGVGSRTIYLTRLTNDDGTWETLPKLIKIR